MKLALVTLALIAVGSLAQAAEKNYVAELLQNSGEESAFPHPHGEQCRTADDCSILGESCIEGYCFVSGCSSDMDCGMGMRCDNGTCGAE